MCLFSPRRVRMLVLAVVVFVFAGGVVGVSLAGAGKGVVGVFGSSGTGDGQFANAYGTAVNTSSGDVYVVDQFNHRVERFDAAGSFHDAFGWGVADGKEEAEVCSSNCLAGLQGAGIGQFDTPSGLAVDQSDGSVYVADSNNNRVERFTPAGGYVSQFGSSGSGDGQFSRPTGIAVDPTDRSVLVVDSINNRVLRFDKTGVFVSAFGWGVADGKEEAQTCTTGCQAGLGGGGEGEFAEPAGIAVDSTGRVYVLDQNNGRVERFTKAGVFDEVFDPIDVFLPQALAVGGSDHVFVAQWAQDFSEQNVVEMDPAGSLVDTHGVGSGASNASGLALGVEDKQVFLADGFNARVFVMGDLSAPTVTIEPAGSVTSTGADLSGSVTPNGNPNVGWHFEISTDDANWSPVAADQDAGNGISPVPVAQALTGLVPNTTYFVRLAATRPFNAPVLSSETQFTTVAITPTVTTQPADDVTPSHAVLPGLVNPNNSPSTYYFEYGPTTAYGTSVPATQDADAGAANVVSAVVRRIDGLTPDTVYHFRLVAQNQAGTTNGADQTFTTGTPPPASTPRAGIPGSGFLPDERGWEKVSPAQKNGADTMADSQRTRIAADGNAANFASLAGFGDAVGTGIATDYESVRHPDGWSTHAIMPPQQPTTAKSILVGLQPLYVGAFSADLSNGVFLGVSPVTNNPGVANVANIYLRTDLKTPGAGSYQLLSACPLCASTSTPLPGLLGNINGGGAPYFAGASTDYGHVIFESQEPLTADAPTGCTDLVDMNQCPGNLYEWDNGTLRLVGILPDGTTAHGSQAGQGAGSFQGQIVLTPHTISADGSRIFFTVPDSPASSRGALYMRVNHTTTVQLNTSERAGSPSSNSATYWDASTDGTRVFFSTSDALTSDAHVGANNKLYMYDASKPDSDPHNLTVLFADHATGDATFSNMVGMSTDGHYVYFATNGQLIAGQPLGGLRIFVWHDGSLHYVSSEGQGDTAEVTNTADWHIRMPTARVTPDGQHLLFSLTAPGTSPTGYDQGHCDDTGLGTGCRELYLYDYASQQIVCVSCNPSGAPATASASTAAQENTSVAQPVSAQNHPLSDDGERVFFSTGEALVPEDVNGRIDAYEYDVPSGTVHLLSSGTERSDSFFMNASSSGNDALFMTRAQLVGSDTDNSYDLYDARVGGGFPEPPPTTASCSGDVCHGPQGVAPGVGVPGTQLLNGAGNVTPVVAQKPVVKKVSNTQKLRKALRACKKKKRAQRKMCESQARKRFGAHRASKSRRSK